MNIFRTLMVIGFVFAVCCSAMAGDWEEFKKKHFVIYYQDAPVDFVKEIEESSERYYKEITQNLGFTRYKGWSWDNRAKIYIYNDQDHYVEDSRGARWSAGHAATSSRTIRTYPSASGFFDTTLPHELGHIIYREFVGERARLPRWFEEGVAMYQEKAKRWGAHRTVRKAIEQDMFIPLNELSITYLSRGTDKELVNLYYAESASIVNYLITEHGKHRFVRFSRELQEGGPFEWALQKVYVRIKDIDDLNDKWVKFLKNK